jgi:glycosyltransferase involved in cell wall biosynthesis
MRKQNYKKNKREKSKYPFVSVCTPTFNRRPFISHMIKCFQEQTYPKHRMEWIIIDDGTDKIEELVSDIPQVKYFKYDKKMTLGKKRNLMHDKSIGEIIVYMDDDDYYPPERVSHAVETLKSNPSALCAGSSEIYIYFKHISKLYQFGPYGPTHATAGTFAFRRKLLETSRYEDDASLAEEKAFLKNYTVPFVQLDPLKTIIVFSHEQNTFDKKKLLDNPHPKFVKESNKTVDMFIKDPDIRKFYMEEINLLLKDYLPGSPMMKPDVIEQIKEIEKKRAESLKNQQQQQQQQHAQIIITDNSGNKKILNNEEIINILEKQKKTINELINIIKQKDNEILMLKSTLNV